MKNKLKRIPLIRILVPFALGIALEAEFRWAIEKHLAFVLFILLLLWGIGFRIQSIRKYKYRHWSGALLYILAFAVGIMYTSLRFENQYKKDFSHIHGSSYYLIEITSPLVEKSKTYKTLGKIIASGTHNQWTTASGKVLIYIQKDSTSNSIEISDRLLISTKPKIVTPPKNPDEFNYKKYLINNQVYHQVYLTKKHWQVLPTKKHWNLYRLANKVRKKLLGRLKKAGVEGEEYAVIAALVYGNKDALDKNLFQSYSSAGAMHVLAVSGLHVGLVFLIFNSLLFFLNKNRTTKIIRSAILLLLLWSYALLTGMSPSVLRSVTMLSFIIMGQILFKKTNIYNTLAASAFALLLYNPFIINKVGFQLSYMAVIGIIYLQPKIYHLFFFNNKIIDKLWALTAVSLAAQIATFPLGILYFHQFPTYFLLSNLFVIPAATIILYLTFLFIAFSWSVPISTILGQLLSLVTELLNFTVKKMELLPHNQILGVVISVFEVYLIYALIIALILGLVKRSTKGLAVSLTIFCLLLFLGIEKKITQMQQKEILLLSLAKETAIVITQGDTCHFIGSSSFYNNEDKMTFHFGNHHNKLGRPVLVFHNIDSLQDYQGSFILIRNNFIQAFDQKIFIGNSEPFLSPVHLSIDTYLVRKNKIDNLPKIIEWMNVKTLIMDGTNNKKTVEKIEEAKFRKNMTLKNLKQEYYYLVSG